MSNTVNNGIPFVPENTIDPAAGLNESLLTVDALLQLAVVSVGGNTPPSSPTNGARYIVGTAPTGAWAGRANQVAQRLDGGWRFYAARHALNTADGQVYVRQGATWGVAPAEWTAETVSQAEAEAGTATTRRAWTAERVRQAILGWWNGATSVFGRGFVASADAAAGRTALELGTAATRAALGSTGSLYSRDSIIGAVSQSGGVPTGAIIERGSNANGEYIKYADGTLVCTTIVDLPAAAIYTQIDMSKPHPHTFSVIDSVLYSAFGQVGSGGQSLVGIVYYNGVYTNATSSENLVIRCFTYREALIEPVRFYFTTHGRWY